MGTAGESDGGEGEQLGIQVSVPSAAVGSWERGVIAPLGISLLQAA